jgi:DNA-binding CsgD family transcriptional regulator
MSEISTNPSANKRLTMRCPSCGVDSPAGANSCISCGASLAGSPEPAALSPTEIAVSSAFVGRQRELATLKAALEDAFGGHGRLVMLAGEPGIGKTRTAQEIAAYAETRGAQVLWGRCYEEEGAPPYWPWVQAIRAYVRDQDPEQLRLEMGPGASDIAEIIPDVRAKLPDLGPSPALEPEQARFRLFDSFTTFLQNTAWRQTLLLVLDDLQWADRSSLLLLEFLTRQLVASPLLVIGTYRDVEVTRRHPLSQALGNLIREQPFLRLQLTGMTQAEVEQLIRKTSQSSPPPSLIETIHRRTEGNPLFVNEVVRALDQEGMAETREYILSVPEGVRDAIGRRLNCLTEECNQVLTTASVIGREFAFKLLSALNTGVTEEQLLAVIDEALEAHLIEELPDGVERYQFSHALIQQTLAEELSTSRKVRIHARIGEALEGLYGANTDAHAAELAYHFAESETISDVEKLARYSLLAGELALASYAWEEALAYFQRGLAAKGTPATGTKPARDADEAALLFGLGKAQGAILQRRHLTEAVATLRRSFDYYAEFGDVAQAVAVADYPLVVHTGHRIGLTDLIARALAIVPPDSHQAGRLLSRLGIYLCSELGDYEGAQEASRRALAIAQREQDILLEIRTLVNAARADSHNFALQECLMKSARVLDLAATVDDPSSEIEAHRNAARVLEMLGDLDGACRHAAGMLSPAEELRDPYLLATTHFYNARFQSLIGEFQPVRESLNRAVAVAPEDSRIQVQLVWLHYQVGDYDTGTVHLERMLESWRQTPPGPSNDYAAPCMIIPLVARMTGQAKWSDIAENVAQTILSFPSTTSWTSVTARACLGLLGVLRSDAKAVGKQYAALESHRGTLTPGGVIGCVDRLVGLFSHTMGNADQAVIHFEGALTFCRKAGYRPELAWSLCDYADTLLQRNSPGDRDKARSLLEELLNISSELGMRPLVERVSGRLEGMASSPAQVPAYPDGLTEREVEVLRLIASGKSNREIAKELVISLGTVANHVTSILNKAGLNNRTEAAGYAIRQGLA